MTSDIKQNRLHIQKIIINENNSSSDEISIGSKRKYKAD